MEYALKEIENLFKEICKKCNDAQILVNKKIEEYEKEKEHCVFDCDEYFVEQAQAEVQCAKARVKALIESKIAIETVYKKIKKKTTKEV